MSASGRGARRPRTRKASPTAEAGSSTARRLGSIAVAGVALSVLVVLLELAAAVLVARCGHPVVPACGLGCGPGGVRLVADTTTVAQGQGQGGGDPTQQFLGIIDRARQWLMWVLTAVVGLIIVFAGLRYAFAGGRIEEIEAAKRTLKAAVTGYLLAVLADSLVSILRMIAGS